MNNLEKRVIELSYKHKLSHIGSCMTAVNVLDRMMQVKKKDEPLVLSSGHAGLALYVALEAWEFVDAEKLLEKHGVHPNRDLENKIYVAAGSLGSAISIAVGMAIANRARNVYVLLSDGECAEGSVWEALRVASDLRLENLRIVVNCNGYGAYHKIDIETLEARLKMFYPVLCVKTNTFSLPYYLQGLQAHYHVLTDAQYEEVSKL